MYYLIIKMAAWKLFLICVFIYLIQLECNAIPIYTRSISYGAPLGINLYSPSSNIPVSIQFPMINPVGPLVSPMPVCPFCNCVNCQCNKKENTPAESDCIPGYEFVTLAVPSAEFGGCPKCKPTKPDTSETPVSPDTTYAIDPRTVDDNTEEPKGEEAPVILVEETLTVVEDSQVVKTIPVTELGLAEDSSALNSESDDDKSASADEEGSIPATESTPAEEGSTTESTLTDEPLSIVDNIQIIETVAPTDVIPSMDDTDIPVNENIPIADADVVPVTSDVVPATTEVVPVSPKMIPVTPEVVPVNPEVVPVTPEVVPVTPEVVPVTPEVVPVTPEVVPVTPDVVPATTENDSVTSDSATDSATDTQL